MEQIERNNGSVAISLEDLYCSGRLEGQGATVAGFYENGVPQELSKAIGAAHMGAALKIR